MFRWSIYETQFFLLTIQKELDQWTYIFRHVKDVYSHNSASVRVASSGEASLQSVVTAQTQCQANVFYYPTYKFTCAAEILFPGYGRRDLNVTFKENLGNVTTNDLSGCWAMTSFGAIPDVIPPSGLSPNDVIGDTNKRFYFMANNMCGNSIAALVSPVVILYIVTLLVFWIPRVFLFRCMMAGFLLLGYVGFLLVVVWQRPHTISHVSLLGEVNVRNI